MADLLDIAPSTAVDVVKIDGQRVTVRCISFNAMASIIARFRGLKSLASGGFGGDDFILRLIEGFGEATAAIIAAGCGHFGDEKYEQHAAKLKAEDQLKLMTAVLGVTFPNGFGSFVQAVTSLIERASGAETSKVFRVRLSKWPSTSQPSSEAASHPTMQ